MKKKAVGIFSGGLDSWLSALLIRDQGFDVYLMHFVSPMFGHKGKTLEKMKALVEEHNMKLLIHEMDEDYVRDVVNNPRHGRGSALNSCIDCHRYMLQLAGIKMKELKAEFVFSGEVLGQRPMSQRKESINLIAKESGLAGFLIRPLSAKLLKASLPEKEGVVDRTKLIDIHGRGRRRQLELAKKLGFSDYPQPSGGCKFTDRNLLARFKKIIGIKKELCWEDLEIISFGRHFSLGDGFYLVLARNESELKSLLKHRSRGVFIEAEKLGGSKGLLIDYDKNFEKRKEKHYMAASIIARYTKTNGSQDVDIILDGKTSFKVRAMDDQEIKKLIVV